MKTCGGIFKVSLSVKLYISKICEQLQLYTFFIYDKYNNNKAIKKMNDLQSGFLFFIMNNGIISKIATTNKEIIIVEIYEFELETLFSRFISLNSVVLNKNINFNIK